MAGLAEDWANLARLVKERREQLGLTQADVETAGGPSIAVVRRIENEQAGKYQPKTLRTLETALRLRAGSVRAALEGGSFTPRESARSLAIPQIDGLDDLDAADRRVILAMIKAMYRARRDNPGAEEERGA